MATQEDDRHRPEGKFTFKIEGFREFARQPVTPPLLIRYSEPAFIRGIPWKILIQKTTAEPEYMGAFLGCMPEKTKNPAWSCEASFTLKIVQQQEGAKVFSTKLHNVFHGKGKDWGYPQWKKFEELLDPGNGWYNELEDTITIEAEVKAKMPRGFGFGIGRQWHRVAKDWLFETGENTICTIGIVDPLNGANNKEIIVHKNVLALHSDVFGAMFTNKDTKECKESRVVIEDTTEQALQQMLHYMYSGKLPPEFKQEEAVELLKVADKYNIEPLAVHCEEKLMDSVAVENVCAQLVLADRHNCHSLRIACSQMIRQNLETVKKRDEWAALRKSHSQLLLDILEELSKEDFK